MARFILAPGYEFDDNSKLSEIADAIAPKTGEPDASGQPIRKLNDGIDFKASREKSRHKGAYDTIIYMIIHIVFGERYDNQNAKILNEYRIKGIDSKNNKVCDQNDTLIQSVNNHTYHMGTKNEIAKRVDGTEQVTSVFLKQFKNNYKNPTLGDLSEEIKSMNWHNSSLYNFLNSDLGNSNQAQTNKENGMEIEEIIKDMITTGGIRQIILTGAPGTGKTRMAKEIAEDLGTSPKQDENGKGIKYEFVQFHPSYDYTDFVEGLRPVKIADRMEFVKMDGTFKAFCRKAAALNNASKSQPDRDGGNTPETKDPLYFFIIDEINRADLSRVFGELMFCLEKDKRGSKVNTQYQMLPTYDVEKADYLEKKDDCFADGFYIPENVVIIGTMNDIDRSVESMDFALRRRFEWQEIEVNKDLLISAFEEMEIPEEIAERVLALNEVIHGDMGKSLGLNRHYDISQGQFANIPASVEKTADKILKYVWKYRIKSLLREYVRGEDEGSVTAFVNECERVFFDDGEVL